MSKQPGTLAECLTDFGQRFSGHHGPDAAARRRLAEFTESNFGVTVRYWILPKERGQKLPGGEKFFRALTFMVFSGYQVREYEVLEPVFQKLALLYGSGVASVDDIAAVLEYSGSGSGLASRVFRAIRNNAKLTADKQSVLDQFVTENEPLLNEAKTEFKRDYAEVLLPKVARVPAKEGVTVIESATGAGIAARVVMPDVPAAPTVMQDESETLPALKPKAAPVAQPVSSQLPDKVVDAMVESMAFHIQAMLPLARLLESDAVGKDVRARLRDRSGDDAGGVFELANIIARLQPHEASALSKFGELLIRLCSEQARKDRRGDRE